ncbi:hypothetical protein IT413_02670 [Candidatus Peregrinibacteria bacterium]|nr:hypothetical protein [Candidatus Peregrinibacteria bacterium]
MGLEGLSDDVEMEGVNVSPRDIDTSTNLPGLYGTTEEEYAATAIVRACAVNNSWSAVDVSQFRLPVPAAVIINGLKALEQRQMIRIEGTVVTPLASFVDPIRELARKK